MARIRNADPKNKSGAYERLFGNAKLGALASKVQSTVISAGYELENMIFDMVKNVGELDDFLKKKNVEDGIFLARKKQIKKSKILHISGGEPDFMIFKKNGDQKFCYVVELKDGHAFDTKKANAEKLLIRGFVERNAKHIPYEISVHFCAFNQSNRQAICEGFKNKITINEAMTGQEFCDLLEINYNDIVNTRRADEPDNVEYLLSELVKIESVRNRLRELLDN